ncbi:glycosyl transferase family 1 [Kineothrix alysoides]|uniref:Glycosyl transferase family 1 n=2 Tax=Kineothrix alysoides TaxID=1469948 RepID=A0A4R1R258_9FIRM|nr:glycosyl transferase family 1 [Kineothrix alysoides]
MHDKALCEIRRRHEDKCEKKFCAIDGGMRERSMNIKMRILWLCNIMLPAIAESLELPYSNREGWLTGIYERMSKDDRKQVELGICFPVERLEGKLKEQDGRWMLGSTVCYAFEENLNSPEKYDESMEARFSDILKDFVPDVVHIFGTEFPHTLAMTRAFGRPERILIGIQGLCFACADAYMADLPEYVQRRRTFRDWIKKDGIIEQQEKFRLRGEHEKQAIRNAGNITGRTVFDREETKKINAHAKYYHMNETMRYNFYDGKWKMEESVPHSIFLSQGDYPLKGFHYVLLAMPKILSEYPDAIVYVAGNSIIADGTMKDRIKISSYGKYLKRLIREYGLKDKVKILGKLSAEEMKRQFLKSSLFICPSSLENSPNSIGEAMLLGVPAVAARTGGIPGMLGDGTEGLLYDAGNVDKLAEAVIKVWMNPEEAEKRAEAARKRAYRTHNGDANYERLLEVYREICE